MVQIPDAQAFEAADTLGLISLVPGTRFGPSAGHLDRTNIGDNDKCTDKVTTVPRLSALNSFGTENDFNAPGDATPGQFALDFLDADLKRSIDKV